MIYDDFNFLCSLKYSNLENYGWSADQAAAICKACTALTEDIKSQN